VEVGGHQWTRRRLACTLEAPWFCRHLPPLLHLPREIERLPGAALDHVDHSGRGVQTRRSAGLRRLRDVRLESAHLALELTPDVVERKAVVLACLAQEACDDVFSRYRDERRLARAQHDGSARRRRSHEARLGERPIRVPHGVQVDAPLVRRLAERWQEVAGRERA